MRGVNSPKRYTPAAQLAVVIVLLACVVIVLSIAYWLLTEVGL
jgi:hypothetical protein